MEFAAELSEFSTLLWGHCSVPKGSKRCFPNSVFQILNLGLRTRQALSAKHRLENTVCYPLALWRDSCEWIRMIRANQVIRANRKFQ